MFRSRITAAMLAAILLTAAFAQGQSQSGPNSGLKFINNPGGGQIVYGPVTGVSTLRDAMGVMLRTVHGHFGDRPQIGKFFQAKGSDSVATFFTLNAKKQGGGIEPIAGLVIVSLAQGSNRPTGAVLFDDGAHFNKTEPVMMKTLIAAWSKDGAQSRDVQKVSATSSRADTHPSASQTLRQSTAGDRSASIGLAPGWQITGVNGGQLIAAGPNGERIALGSIYQQIHDPRSMQYGGGGGGFLVASYSNLYAAFVSITNQVRQSKGLPPATFKLISSQNLPGQAIQAIFEVDLHDGKGPRKGSARIGTIITRGLPTWAMTVSQSNAPIAVADAENATMLAMIRSYSQDVAVIGRETQVVIDRIHATAAAAQIRANAQSAANDAHNQAFDQHMKDIDSSNKGFDQHMDDIDRSSKAFQNYQFDSSQLQDNELNARGTVANRTADALVKADPDRFQIINRPDFIKGIDY